MSLIPRRSNAYLLEPDDLGLLHDLQGKWMPHVISESRDEDKSHATEGPRADLRSLQLKKTLWTC